jgi:hypothetical protein
MTTKLLLFTTRSCAECEPVKQRAQAAALEIGIDFSVRDAQDEALCAHLYRVSSVPALVLLVHGKAPRVTTKAKTKAQIIGWIKDAT